MDAVFWDILDRSVSASILVMVVVGLRLVLKKAPRGIYCLFWAMVALRLVCPALPECDMSMIPDSRPVSSVIQTDQKVVSDAVQSEFEPNIPEVSVYEAEEVNDKLQWQDVLPFVWIAGVAAMGCYGAVSYLILRRNVEASVKEDGVWICDDISTPFILGILRPRIYLPSGLDECCRDSVLAHELAHIRRKDHWWKPFGFVLLSLHWFNPVLWLGYILLCRDIEGACDEQVVKNLDLDARKSYSEAMLSCSVSRGSIAACPLAFGEQNVKGRIKAVLDYKKPGFWIIVAAFALAIIVAACFLTNPKRDDVPVTPTTEAANPATETNDPPSEIIPPEQTGDHALLKTEDLEVLRQKVPEYFRAIQKGTEIWIWEQEGELYCGAMGGTNRNKTDEEIQALIGVSLPAMAKILDTYSIPDWDISLWYDGDFSQWSPEYIEYPNDWFRNSPKLRDQLGLYTVSEGEEICDFTVVGPISGEKGFFVAKAYNGLYRVYCQDVSQIQEGLRLEMSYVNKKELAPMDSCQFEITAQKIFVTLQVQIPL